MGVSGDTDQNRLQRGVIPGCAEGEVWTFFAGAAYHVVLPRTKGASSQRRERPDAGSDSTWQCSTLRSSPDPAGYTTRGSNTTPAASVLSRGSAVAPDTTS